MNAERYKKIDELFDAVLEVEPADRQEVLHQLCGSDAELRNEVESLLAAYTKAEHFIEMPAMEVAAKSLAEDQQGSLIGKQIAHYTIVSLLGAGGMGEVYLAEDARLRRKVALKLLPAQFTKDADRVVRFQRESRAASGLNHPNIITIYEIGHEQGLHFIASEYIEGDTLRRRIQRGKLLVKEALDITMQAASALSAAHQAGIIHRDIKPENIMIRRDGYVKVLDFGLVKLTEMRDHTGDPASQVSLSTKSGAVLGTVNYMSPEQALGQEVDERTDIFSLGVVLYEMLSGQLPFKGATIASTFDAILNKQPEALRSSNPQVSLELERIVNRVLEKDREVRYQTAADLRAVLRRLQKNLDSGITASADAIATGSVPKARRTVSHWWMKAAIGFAALAIFFALAAFLFVPRKSEPDDLRWKNAAVTRVTDQEGEEVFPSLSPDGQSVVYAARGSGNYDIYFKRVGSRKITNLTEGSEAQETQPALSHDGKRIAFRRTERDGSGGIFTMTITGESVRPLTAFGFNPAWSPDNKEIVFAENSVDSTRRTFYPSQMWIVNVTTGDYRVLSEKDAVQPNWSPNGKRIAYWAVNEDTNQRDIWTISPQGGDPVAVTNDAFADFNPVWSADGKFLYFLSSRNGTMTLWRIAIDEASGKVEGEPAIVSTSLSPLQHISFSSDGKHLAFVHVSSKQNIEKINFDPLAEKLIGQPVAITHFSGEVGSPAISPNGEILAFHTFGETHDILTLKLSGAVPNSVTEDKANDLLPAWSPDGKRLAFYSNRSGIYQIWTINPDGSGAQQITQMPAPGAVVPVWSPDGSLMAYSIFGGKAYIMDLRKRWDEQTPVATPSGVDILGHFVAHSWSPDGKYLAGSGYKIHHIGLFVYEIATNRYERIGDSGTLVRWLSDNRRLLFINDDKLMITDLQSRKPREIYSFAPRILSGMDISKDNRSIFVSASNEEADIWLLSIK